MPAHDAGRDPPRLEHAGDGRDQFPRALRADPGGSTPVVLFCTTETEMTKIQQAIEAGANEYIMKPFDSEIVESKLSQVGLL